MIGQPFWIIQFWLELWIMHFYQSVETAANCCCILSRFFKMPLLFCKKLWWKCSSRLDTSSAASIMSNILWNYTTICQVTLLYVGLVKRLECVSVGKLFPPTFRVACLNESWHWFTRDRTATPKTRNVETQKRKAKWLWMDRFRPMNDDSIGGRCVFVQHLIYCTTWCTWDDRQKFVLINSDLNRFSHCSES